MKSHRMIAIGLLAGLAVLWGCESSNKPETPAQGAIRILLIDAPAEYDAVSIVVREVSVHVAGADSTSGWQVVNDSTRTFDLLTLTNGVSAVLGDATLDAGEYTQIRLKLAPGSTVVVDGVEYPLEVPSGLQTGIKLNHPFVIEPNTLYELTLDFDAARSINDQGNNEYSLKPVIRVAAVQISGTISGVVDPPEARGFVWTVAGADTVSTLADTTTGLFRLMGLRAGTYDVHIEPLEPAYQDSILTGVVVQVMQNTDVGTIPLPLR